MAAKWDVAVIGAGTSGAAAALQCARRGLSVICVDQRPLGAAGANWINGVAGSMFDEADVAQPCGAERSGEPEAFHLLAGRGPSKVVIRDHDLLDVDMGLLVLRLQQLAADAGAELRGGVRVLGLDDGGLVVADGEPVRARWYVDAAGLAGPRLLAQPTLPATDLCAAAQQTRLVANRDQALSYLAGFGVAEGETMSFSAVAGGYSIVNCRLAGDRVFVLTGSVPAQGHPPGQRLIDELVAQQSWIGPALAGGKRSVPLHRPRNRIADDRVALLGDSACQVYAAHGSGIGTGLIAARVLAEELAAGRGTRSYARRWMRTWGWQLASADLVRRFTQNMELEQVARMFDSGLLSEPIARSTLMQRQSDALVAASGQALPVTRRDPKLAVRLTPVLARAAAARALYAGYPASDAGLRAWSAAADRLLGE